MIAFAIHCACSSTDTVMFAESLEQFLERYIKKHGHAVFEKTGEIDSGMDFGNLYRLGWQIGDKVEEKLPTDFQAFKEYIEKKGWKIEEPEYVTAHTITDDLELSFGD